VSLIRFRLRADGPQVGDRRIVRRFFIARCVAGEWRLFGCDRIEQEYCRYPGYVSGFGPVNWVGWRDKAWASS